MEERVNRRAITVFLVVVVNLVLGVRQGVTVDLSSIIEDAKVKHAKFEEAVRDITIVQEMKIVAPEGEMLTKMNVLRKGGKFRMETTIEMPKSAQMPEGMEKMEAILIYDGKDIWMISFMGKNKLSPEEGKQYQKERNWWELISKNAEIVGTESVSDRGCYVVEIKEEESPFTKIWLDKKSLILVKAESKSPEGETILLICSDFRGIKGDWEIPYKTEMFASGELMSTSLVKSLELDKGLSDDLFNPDKVEVKGLDMQEMMKKMMNQEEGE